MNDPDWEEIVGTSLLEKEFNNDMSELKRHLISLGITFGSTFLLIFCTALSSDGFSISKSSLVALGASAMVAGVRAVAKIVVEWFTK